MLALALSSCGSLTPPGSTFVDLGGAQHAPLDASDAKANVLLFITVDCPIANGYSPTIRKLVKDFAPRGVRFYLIHVDPDVTEEIARQHAKDFLYESPVLIDSDHALVRHLEATHTPEAFVLTHDGGVVYRGRIDDWYGDLGKKRPAPRKHELRAALDALLAGEPVPVARTEPVGCFIPEL
jgi:hypothetical protein